MNRVLYSTKMANKYLSIIFSIYICGGYNLVFTVKECYKLDLSDIAKGWVQIASLNKGRFNHKMVAAKGKVYAVGGEGPFYEHDDIEVRILVIKCLGK